MGAIRARLRGKVVSVQPGWALRGQQEPVLEQPKNCDAAVETQASLIVKKQACLPLWRSELCKT